MIAIHAYCITVYLLHKITVVRTYGIPKVSSSDRYIDLSGELDKLSLKQNLGGKLGRRSLC